MASLSNRRLQDRLVANDAGHGQLAGQSNDWLGDPNVEAVAYRPQGDRPPRPAVQEAPDMEPLQVGPAQVPNSELATERPLNGQEFLPATPGTLDLNAVLLSVEENYPLLFQAMLEQDRAFGQQIAAWGAFDLQLKAYTTAAPEGFYQTYRNGVSVSQPLWGGGYLTGGFKIGDGNFQPWFKERETNEGGEFSVGYGSPLLRGREIDKRRAAVMSAQLQTQTADYFVQAQLLEFWRAAAQSYWNWVAAGQRLRVQQYLLDLAKERVDRIESQIELGGLRGIARINNSQLIASRETKVIEAERKIEQAAIKLSLFWRDAAGEPLLPQLSELPPTFPAIDMNREFDPEGSYMRAIALSPYLQQLDYESRQARVDLNLAENDFLPKLDAMLTASQDLGARASSTGDKTPFELEFGLVGELPVQRRMASGKIQQARAKIAQIEAKIAFADNKIRTGIQDALSAIEAALNRLEQAELNLSLARETLELADFQLTEGKIEIIELNLYEQAVADAETSVISASADYFSAEADLDALLAVGLQPIQNENPAPELP